GDRVVPRLDHLLQGVLLVLHIALDRLDEVRDEVVATLELNVNLRPGVVGLLSEPYKAVVHRESHYNDRDDQNKKHDQETHFFLRNGSPPVPRKSLPDLDAIGCDITRGRWAKTRFEDERRCAAWRKLCERR